jgi:hypothetical protein
MARTGSRIEPEDPDRFLPAAGYMDAMHGLCIECHKERAEELGRPRHGDCATCHRTTVEDDRQMLADRRDRYELAPGGTG